MPPGAPPPTGLLHRFGLLIEGLQRAVADGARRNRTSGPMIVLLWGYLGRTLRRLAALHARFEAGTLDAMQRRISPRRPPTKEPAAKQPAPERLRPRIPSGPVLMGYWVAHLRNALEQLVEEPEMRRLLAAAPEAGRLLRPLWRRLTVDPLPEALRRPPRPRRPEPLAPPEPDAAAALPPPDSPPRPYPAAPSEPSRSPPYRPPKLLPA